jgi:hypothetical protein
MACSKEAEFARIRSDAYKEQRRLYRQTKQYKAKYCSEEAKLKRRLREQTPEFKARRNAYLASRRLTERRGVGSSFAQDNKLMTAESLNQSDLCLA